VSIISGCAESVPNILHIGECERGIVTEENIEKIKSVWPETHVTDILISGGCYQDRFIKKR
jgi:hypothetical protein